jgi:7-cyano-7-deazaguanine synthase
VVLLSGGLDSAANLAFCRNQDEPILALTAAYGQRAQEAETKAALTIAHHFDVPHQSVDLSWLGRLGGSSLTEASWTVPELKAHQLDDRKITEKTAQAVWVPNRNGVLLNVAAAFAERLGAERVVVGFNAEEAATFADNSQEFMNRTSRALELSTRSGILVHSYTAAWSKSRIVAELRKVEPRFPFDKVWSCYEAGPNPCRVCESCLRFARAVNL